MNLAALLCSCSVMALVLALAACDKRDKVPGPPSSPPRPVTSLQHAPPAGYRFAPTSRAQPSHDGTMFA